MSLNNRIASFLNNAATQTKPVRVEAFSDKRQSSPSNAFINALKVGIPSLLLVASVNAQSVTPEVQMSVDNGPIPTQSASTATQLLVKSLLTASIDRRAAGLIDCFEEKVANPDLTPADKVLAALLLRAQAGKTINDMDEHARETGVDPNLLVAAYCANPLDWKGTWNSWEQKAERATAMVRGQSPMEHLENEAQASLARYAAQSATLHGAVQYAAHYQSDGQFDRSLMHKVSGNDWISAAMSIASGVAEATGSRESRNTVRNVKRRTNTGKSIANSVKNLDRYSGARKWEQVGHIVGRVGREVDLGEALSRLRPR